MQREVDLVKGEHAHRLERVEARIEELHEKVDDLVEERDDGETGVDL